MRSYYFTMKYMEPSESRVINYKAKPDFEAFYVEKWGYVEVKARTSNEARSKMTAKHGLVWGFEYNTLEEVHPLDRNLIEVIE